MHMHDILTIDTIVFEIVGKGLLNPLTPGSLSFPNASDQIGLTFYLILDVV